MLRTISILLLLILDLYCFDQISSLFAAIKMLHVNRNQVMPSFVSKMGRKFMFEVKTEARDSQGIQLIESLEAWQYL